jgi:hypothetical protein
VHRSIPVFALLVLLVVLLTPPTPAGASGRQVLSDCAFDYELDRTYSQADYAAALAEMTSDLDEYSDCRDTIRKAQLAGLRGGGSSGGGTAGGASGQHGAAATSAPSTAGGSGSALGSDEAVAASASPVERASIQRAVERGAAPVQLDGRPIDAAALGGAAGRGIGDLPAPLVALIGLLAAALTAGTAVGVHHVWARRCRL